MFVCRWVLGLVVRMLTKAKCLMIYDFNMDCHDMSYDTPKYVICVI